MRYMCHRTDGTGNTSSAYVDNFIVTAAPEPSGLVMLLGASKLIGVNTDGDGLFKFETAKELSVHTHLQSPVASNT